MGHGEGPHAHAPVCQRTFAEQTLIGIGQCRQREGDDVLINAGAEHGGFVLCLSKPMQQGRLLAEWMGPLELPPAHTTDVPFGHPTAAADTDNPAQAHDDTRRTLVGVGFTRGDGVRRRIEVTIPVGGVVLWVKNLVADGERHRQVRQLFDHLLNGKNRQPALGDTCQHAIAAPRREGEPIAHEVALATQKRSHAYVVDDEVVGRYLFDGVLGRFIRLH
ncbi:MAG: hypothetical protein DWI54_05990 [Chloroflexi bacterium]|nr:MAG: hypothetical protein DWI54_05990 [Chloroflexota bacterium]